MTCFGSDYPVQTAPRHTKLHCGALSSRNLNDLAVVGAQSQWSAKLKRSAHLYCAGQPGQSAPNAITHANNPAGRAGHHSLPTTHAELKGRSADKGSMHHAGQQPAYMLHKTIRSAASNIHGCRRTSRCAHCTVTYVSCACACKVVAAGPQDASFQSMCCPRAHAAVTPLPKSLDACTHACRCHMTGVHATT